MNEIRRKPSPLLKRACVLTSIVCAPALAAVAPTPASASTVSHEATALLGRPMSFAGAVAGTRPGDRVQVQRRRSDGTWTPTASTRVDRAGRFRVTWRTKSIGRFAVRAVKVVPATLRAQSSGDRVPPTAVSRLTVFRPALATYYGPGLYGNKTACGQTMTPELMGVAHKRLPCGTLVDVNYAGKTITVPVVDRGPFANNAEWDLTFAAASELKFTATDTIGAVRLRDSDGGVPTPGPPPAPGDPASGGAAAG